MLFRWKLCNLTRSTPSAQHWFRERAELEAPAVLSHGELCHKNSVNRLAAVQVESSLTLNNIFLNSLLGRLVA